MCCFFITMIIFMHGIFNLCNAFHPTLHRGISLTLSMYYGSNAGAGKLCFLGDCKLLSIYVPFPFPHGIRFEGLWWHVEHELIGLTSNPTVEIRLTHVCESFAVVLCQPFMFSSIYTTRVKRWSESASQWRIWLHKDISAHSCTKVVYKTNPCIK